MLLFVTLILGETKENVEEENIDKTNSPESDCSFPDFSQKENAPVEPTTNSSPHSLKIDESPKGNFINL